MSSALSSTTQLIRRHREGDHDAQNELATRYWTLLRRWAHARLPAGARDLADTEDLVQETLVRATGRLETFKAEKPGAFLAYLRTILRNLIREELRKHRVRPIAVALEQSIPDTRLSPADIAVNDEVMQVYEKALSSLSSTKRMAVIMRLEFGMTYREIATELEQPSIDSARMMTTRAVADVTESMRNERRSSQSCARDR